MARFLGFDFGQKRIGVACAIDKVISPLETIEYKNWPEAERKILTLCRSFQPQALIWGISKGPIGTQTRKIALKIAKMVELPVEFIDETLTSIDADLVRRQSKVKKIKNDALAAAIILEYFLSERGWNV